MERTGWLCPLPVGDLGPQQWETYNFRHHWENLSPEPREGSGSPPPSAPPRTVHQNLEGCRTISRAARRHLNCGHRMCEPIPHLRQPHMENVRAILFSHTVKYDICCSMTAKHIIKGFTASPRLECSVLIMAHFSLNLLSLSNPPISAS
ncbi:uncharacterized protein LOC144339418 isoform X1 [Macaca mulatta]